MTIIGIDPGQSGGIALLTEGYVAIAHKMPDTPADIMELIGCFRETAFAYLERVHAMPKQGIASTAQNSIRGSHAAEVAEGQVHARRRGDRRHPDRAMGCLTGGDKSISKRKAQQLFPHIKMTHALADALLICEYGRRKRLGLAMEPAPDKQPEIAGAAV